MRRLLILGAGAAGTMAASLLRRKLPEDQSQITVIDRDNNHHYQAGYLFIPFVPGMPVVSPPTWGMNPFACSFLLLRLCNPV